MRVSEVRGKVLADHGQLRELLGEAAGLAWAVIDGDHDSPALLRKKVIELDGPLARHIDDEEPLLRALFEPLQAWGGMHLLHVRVNHAHQRELIAELCAKAADPRCPSQ